MNFTRILLVLGLVISAFMPATFAYWSDPSTCTGGWSGCFKAYSWNDDNANATANPGTSSKTSTWNGYSFNSVWLQTTPGPVTVFVSGSTTLGAYMQVRISANGGTNWGPWHTVTSPTYVDVSNDVNWQSATQLKVQVKCATSFGGSCRLDWLPVDVA